MKQICKITVLIVSIFLLTSCRNISEEVESTNLDQVRLNEVSDFSLEAIEATYGKPTEIEVIQKPASKVYSYQSSSKDFEMNVNFLDENNQAQSVGLSAPKYSFVFNGNKIAVGDSVEQVELIFGKDFYQREESGFPIMGYLDKENVLNLEFTLTKDKIIQYILFYRNAELFDPELQME